jgi:hypothetical protein
VGLSEFGERVGVHFGGALPRRCDHKTEKKSIGLDQSRVKLTQKLRKLTLNPDQFMQAGHKDQNPL